MAVESSMLALGTPAPSFTLPQPATGATVSLDELTGPALVVTFICNHCPYVQHVAAGLATLGRDLADQGVPMVGISSNDVVTYPQDGPDQMVAEARRHGWRSRISTTKPKTSPAPSPRPAHPTRSSSTASADLSTVVSSTTPARAMADR
ncbi:Conserved exported protein of uncharacterised function [Mycobacterium tuberculosis]|nr:Conserved exported protein of uncharacterised function [Mycobacterium tuberculosis]